MKADLVEVSRDEHGKGWLIRIQVGEEVIRRHCHDVGAGDESALRAAAVKTAADEGYSVDPKAVVITSPAA